METQVFVNLNNTMPRSRAMMAARKRKPCGCRKRGLGDSIPTYNLSTASGWSQMLTNAVEEGISPFGGALQIVAPVGSTPFDALANAAGKPIVQNEQTALDSQTTSQVQQACGNQANTAWCQQQIQSALSAVNASIAQSNQQLAGPPYSLILGAENLLNGVNPPKLPSLPSWIWWAAAALGFVLIYEAA